jgi:hypothetical protein
MSIFNWLFSKSVHQQDVPQSDHVQPKTVDAHAPLKIQRMDHRQHAYQIVRDVMLRSEVLAANYSFKVLSLDGEGRQFVIMMDLRQPELMQIDILDGMEKLMISSALSRFDLRVKSVYWRCTALPPSVAPVPVLAIQQPPARPAKRSPARTGAFDPIQQDEVLAFKRALTASQPAATVKNAGQPVKSGPRFPTPPTGFADTEMIDPDGAPLPLSHTQYGEL